MCGSWACSKDAIGASLPSSLRQPAAVTPVTASVGSLALAELFEKSTLFFSSDSTFFTHSTRGEGEGCNLLLPRVFPRTLDYPVKVSHSLGCRGDWTQPTSHSFYLFLQVRLRILSLVFASSPFEYRIESKPP